MTLCNMLHKIGSDFGQRVAQKLHTTLGNIRDLGTELHTTLGNMLHRIRGLRNRIAYDFGQHVAQNLIGVWAI